MNSKHSLKTRLKELDALGFPERVKNALLVEVNKKAATALEKIVREVVTPHSLAAIFANGDMAQEVKARKKRKQVMQEGGSPFAQDVHGSEPGTVTGS